MADGTESGTRPLDPQQLVDRVGDIFVGKRDVVEKIVVALLANGHVLLEDVPGTGKTLLMKILSNLIGCEYRRVQGTPDLLPGDILGSEVWDTKQEAFELQRGPIFTNILLFDEINRVPPKALSALLEASEERNVTIGGETLKLPRPFLLLATQNPIEFEGTWVLPEAQLDRFLMKMSTGYLESTEEENLLLKRRIEWQTDDPADRVGAIVDKDDIVQAQRFIEERIRVDDAILDYISRVVRATRDHHMAELGASPRGSLALLKTTRALAFVRGRRYVVPDDVKMLAPDCLRHRVILKMDHAIEDVEPDEVVEDVLEEVTVPKRVEEPMYDEAKDPATPSRE